MTDEMPAEHWLRMLELSAGIKKPFDWNGLLGWFSEKYRAQVAIAEHIFGAEQRIEILFSSRITPEHLALHVTHARDNPWQNVYWSKPERFFIMGFEISPFPDVLERSNFFSFHQHVMIPQNIHYGIGAILYKDRAVGPERVRVIALARSITEGPFEKEELDDFEKFIGHMSVVMRDLVNSEKNPLYTSPQTED